MRDAMGYRPDNPLIIQSDQSVLAEVASPRFAEARDRLARFAELVKSPEHVHTYRITPLSVWNACAAGADPAEIVEGLREFAKYPVPANVESSIRDAASRYGRLRLARDDQGLVLCGDDPALLEEVSRTRGVAPHLDERLSATSFRVATAERGRVKQALVKAGWPAEDLAGYTPGEPLPIELRSVTRGGEPFALRDYQTNAASAFHAGGTERGGSGVVVLPCGAGKTVVGMECMARVGSSTLVLTTSVTAVRQWIREILDRTTLQEDQVGEYTGQAKDVKPVTVATYQVLTHRESKEGAFPHLELFDQRDWGLIVYDEVHLLPAPVFQVTAGLQARRRLGLTATLVREDGREDDVFSLIGPKRYDAPWRDIEAQGYIAPAECIEVRVSLDDEERMTYAVAEPEERYRIAATAQSKLPVIRRVLERHPDEPSLVIGAYLDQLEELGTALDAPVIQGSTTNREREKLFDAFRQGEIRTLVVSKVANFSIDLPEAAVAVQVSGTFGSRQEEAQRLGRVLRPKADGRQAHFYTVVSRDTLDSEYAAHRQRFLAEQGYAYTIVDAADLAGPGEVNGPGWVDEPAD